MTSRMRDWEPRGDADPLRTRRALAVDAALALVLAMLAWPFPVMRANLDLPAHVAALVAFSVFVQALYGAVCVRIWGRTPGLYLTDLGLTGAERPFGPVLSVRWGAGFALAVVAALGSFGTADPGSGLPARFSGLATVSTRA